MSVCLESTAALATPVATAPVSEAATAAPTVTPSPTNTNSPVEPSAAPKSVAKIIVTNTAAVNSGGTAVLQKVVNSPLITVLNSSGPLTVVKSLCVTSGVTTAPQFTLVNNSPLTVTNTGKSPTITLVTAPVTLVKAVPPVTAATTAEQCNNAVVSSSASVSAITTASSEKSTAIHNVFVKNTCTPELVPSISASVTSQQDMPQSHKILTANAFPQTVIPSVTPLTAPKTLNGQKPPTNNKVKILSNVVMSAPGAGPSNLLLNKNNTQQRYLPRQKIVGNSAPTKYLNKVPVNNILKASTQPVKNIVEKISPRSIYPTHKSHIKTLPSMNTYNMQQKPPGIKTIPPQKGIPGQIQRTGAGLRTIPPQRPPKQVQARPNYIGKHAIQAQKIKAPNKGNLKQNHHNLKASSPMYAQQAAASQYVNQINPVTFNQALTQEIIDTLSSNDTSRGMNSYCGITKRYRPPTPEYDCSAMNYENKDAVTSDSLHSLDEKPQSSLSTLSLICHAVYLDHNYNATLPPDSPTRPTSPHNAQPQINGLPGNSMYSPGSSGGRSLVTSSNTTTTLTSLSTSSLVPSNASSGLMRDDDAASDISCGSDRKMDTEGEETDTAPEAEAVNNDDRYADNYGDYVTRCICGFLHDDGYMIECDQCKVWQHVRCVVKNKQVPDEYLCEVCDPSKSVDRQKARLLQQQWMRDVQLAMDAKLRKDGKFKEQIKSKDILSDTDSSDGEHVKAKGKLATQTRRKSEPTQKQNSNSSARQRRDSTRDSVARRPTRRKERKIVKRKVKPPVKSQTDEDNHDSWANSQLPQLRQWIEHYEEAVTNHYSPELRARISSIRINGAHTDGNTQMDPSVNKCRVHMQPLTGLKYLVSTVHLPPETAVIELRGKYMLSTQHRNSGGNLTTRQHAQRPGPFLFFYRLHRDNTEVCVDTRTYGNSARFVRRSCRPNAELRHCIEKGVLHLYIVTIAEVEKNIELTIKHESHDLAAAGTTHIACACGNSDDCGVNSKGGVAKRNGESKEVSNLRKRRGRRANSTPADSHENNIKEEEHSPVRAASPPPAAVPEVKIKQEDEIKQEPLEDVEEIKVKAEEEDLKTEIKEEVEVIKSEVKEEERTPSPEPLPPPPPVTTRRASYKSEPDEKKETPPSSEEKKKEKKLSREERKIEAYMKAFERMERLQQRRQEHQAKQAHRRESEPTPGKDEDKNDSKVKRRKRKGRSRTISVNSQRRNRLNSADSSYATSGDEMLLSPSDHAHSKDSTSSKDRNDDATPEKGSGMLLSLANGDAFARSENSKSPTNEMDSNSNSAHSSPETPLSSACLLVAAAVGPLEPGFKFPKTKKGLMNEWLNNKTEIQSASTISPSSLTSHVNTSSEYDMNAGYYVPSKSLTTLAHAANFCDSPIQPRGSAKKRWLRQAISEDQGDSPNSRPESPPMSEAVAPPKKRRLPRVSLSANNSPPTTPTSTSAPTHLPGVTDPTAEPEGRVEIVYSGTEGDSPTQTLESDAVLKERAAEMQQEFGACVRLSEGREKSGSTDVINMGCLMDPRLARDRGSIFSNSEHLVGTVEKTLSYLGFEDKKVEKNTPTKRKLSITEYRQRKKLNNNDKVVEETIPEEQENNASQSPKASRQRSGSMSSTTSFASSDDEAHMPDIAEKAPSAFNSEPTELERQRESVNLRLKKALGLSLDEDRKPSLNMESFLNWEVPTVKTSFPLSSPTFPIPGSSELLVNKEQPAISSASPPRPTTPTKQQTPPPEEPTASPVQPIETEEPPVTKEDPKNELEVEKHGDMPKNDADHKEKAETVLYYTPDEEEAGETEKVVEKLVELETSYVPPFNNPLYPNNSYSSYGSVIDDNAPYEGRNPSPPPELGVSDGSSYSLS